MTRYHDVSQLTMAELELAKRQLQANLGLITPHSPAHAPIRAHMQAIDAELAGRTGIRQSGESERRDGEILPGPPTPRHHLAGRDSDTPEPSVCAGLDTE
jgi:hypothetical protein